MKIPKFNALRSLWLLIVVVSLSLSISNNCIAQKNESQKNREILINVTIKNNKGNYIGKLDKSLFVISDGKTTPELQSFWNEDLPASIALVLDTSASMRLGDTQTSFTPAQLAGLVLGFVKQSNKENDYLVLGYNERPQVLGDWTQSEKAISDAFASQKWKGQTAFYDACFFGIQKLAQAKNRKRVLFIITDGAGDNASDHKRKEVEQLMLKSPDVLVYSVVLPSDPLTQIAGGETYLQLSEASGGRSLYTKNIKELTSAFELIALELRNQYLLGFKSAEDDKEHQIKIKLNLPDDAAPQLRKVSIRSREKYLAVKKIGFMP